jgi:hypothetical protein
MTHVKGPIISFADPPSIEAYLLAHEGSEIAFGSSSPKPARRKQPSKAQATCRPSAASGNNKLAAGRAPVWVTGRQRKPVSNRLSCQRRSSRAVAPP